MGLDNLNDISTIKELAEFLKVNEATIRRAIDSGKLKALKVGKSWRIEKEEVIKWLQEGVTK
jgi:excisionase family DNA binding protein